MTDTTRSPWLPHLTHERDGSATYPIRYLATDNEFLPDITSALRSANDEPRDPLALFVDTLLNKPAVDIDGLFVLPKNPEHGTEDITDDEYILENRRWKKGGTAESENNDDNSGDEPANGMLVLSTTNLVGIIYSRSARERTAGDVQLSISSRFFRDERGDIAPIWHDWFLAYMMQRVLHVNLLSVDFEGSPERAWRQLLMWMFPLYLNNAMSKGVLHQYERREYNDSNPRGRIDIARHIRENTPFLGTVAYSRREYDADNPVTELIRHTIEAIAANGRFGSDILHNSSETIRHVEEIRRVTQRYEQAERQRIVQENLKRPVRHAFYDEYRELQSLCIAILSHRGLDPSDIKEKGVHGILFDCAWLWEEYLNVVLREQGIGVIHPQNKTGTHAYHFMTRVEGTDDHAVGKPLGLIYPDYLLSVDGVNLVADAKYKPEQNIGGRDYMQVIAYTARFGTGSGLYLYPGSDLGAGGSVDVCEYLLFGGFERERESNLREEPALYTVGLDVSVKDCSAGYRGYVASMHEHERKFAEEIRRIAQNRHR
ncbi:5-methylcytosine restriction system specificity protein McrC [Bifidobacterium animalis]|uniref:5-methylcytosine restriction system specificity protein McrC n=1 Tax=Bifidobacterium animalis TaxID=28025 RepID=UPI00101EE62F|nr:3-isopropylmalate dehydrogenase [Bifidobacterium animalis]RYM94007.1 3-isopropylmalate dehydrogenase [Bifidobacterium animalis subsp. lactis]RYM94203.1 3-isopropylmalate dehydrogenase [Bifidobacterium animalis subsp. lactis]